MLFTQGANKAKEVNMQAYCMKCRAKREIKNPQKTTMTNGRNALKGVCSVCGTKMFKFVK